MGRCKFSSDALADPHVEERALDCLGGDLPPPRDRERVARFATVSNYFAARRSDYPTGLQKRGLHDGFQRAPSKNSAIEPIWAV